MGDFIRFAARLVASVLCVPTSVASAQHVDAERASTPAILSAGQIFDVAESARQARDFETAQAAYRALFADADPELRIEARFRLGLMLADDLQRYSDAAVEFRHILDVKPHAARVRLELARVLAASGDVRAAGREMRAAQAAGLPPQVEQMVRFYANALSARKTLGGSIELALAPDSNVNRATRSDRLGTVIGDFLLDKDAQEKSGVGLSLRGQGYWRHGIEPGADLLVRASVGASLYRDASFNDISAALQVGPQYLSGSDRITVAAGPSWRWYGDRLYSTGYGGSANLLHPVGKRSQLQLEGGVTHVRNQRNALQTADDFTLAGAFDHAFSARGGGGVQMFALREAARDPGYSFVSGGGSVYGFREMGRTTFVATMGYSHLEADARLLLYPRRRIENRLSASIGATLRALQVGPFAPLARLKWERNRSTIEIYQYRRISAEFGIGSVF